MIKYFCDRCGKEVDKLACVKIPDSNKPCSGSSYSTKEVGLCDSCNTFVNKAVEEYNQAMIKTRFAFYEALFPKKHGGDSDV